jgi:hypothetical protein
LVLSELFQRTEVRRLWLQIVAVAERLSEVGYLEGKEVSTLIEAAYTTKEE